jgi:hypothetical protein
MTQVLTATVDVGVAVGVKAQELPVIVKLEATLLLVVPGEPELAATPRRSVLGRAVVNV